LEGDLASSAVAGGIQTLEALAANYGPQLHRFLRAHMRDPSEAADLLQEVYLRMLRVPHLESIQSPEAYLFTVARHVVQQHALRSKAIPESLDFIPDLDNPIAGPDADPALQASAQQTLDEMQSALENMSPKVRAAFLLHRRDGLSIDEIGEVLGVTRPMVKKYLVRALMRLRQQLEHNS
jgi:RNA polymerase sigma-70 factor (ECF subfamily)